MDRAGSLEAGQELYGLAKLDEVGQICNLFSGLWEEDGWRNYREFALSLSSPCVPFKRKGGRRLANMQKDKSTASRGR